jgi:hypothetical protein
MVLTVFLVSYESSVGGVGVWDPVSGLDEEGHGEGGAPGQDCRSCSTTTYLQFLYLPDFFRLTQDLNLYPRTPPPPPIWPTGYDSVMGR